MIEERNAYKVLVGKRRKSPPGRRRFIWENNIKTGQKMMVRCGWIYLGQDREQSSSLSVVLKEIKKTIRIAGASAFIPIRLQSVTAASTRSLAGFYEHANEPSGSITCWEFLTS
jgi:hypothetical protein